MADEAPAAAVVWLENVRVRSDAVTYELCYSNGRKRKRSRRDVDGLDELSGEEKTKRVKEITEAALLREQTRIDGANDSWRQPAGARASAAPRDVAREFLAPSPGQMRSFKSARSRGRSRPRSMTTLDAADTARRRSGSASAASATARRRERRRSRRRRRGRRKPRPTAPSRSLSTPRALPAPSTTRRLGSASAAATARRRQASTPAARSSCR